ncbi:MAG: alpha/beta fold hydrolase [Bacteroidetes bacterium]|nr:alpha/beta fold hydrolase [Bacteroidota bacterium]
MLQYSFIAALLWHLCSPLYAQDITGYWQGRLEAGGQSLKIAFYIDVPDTGGYCSFLYVPQQGVQRLPATRTTFQNNRLQIRFDNLEASFRGQPSGDTLEGTWHQNGQEIRTRLVRLEAPAAAPLPETPANRPQTPLPPFPYTTEEVDIPGPQWPFSLAGTLTLPRQLPPKATILLITGSGPQDRDETIMEHKPFAVIADHFTRLGYAVLRVDDRGMGESGGTLEGATSLDFAQDAKTCLAYLRLEKRLAGVPIGLLGHSEGGLIAAMIAEEEGDSLDFFIMLAGPGQPGYALLADQSRAMMLANGHSKATTEACYQLIHEWLDIALNSVENTAAAQEAGMEAYRRWREEQPPKVLTEHVLLALFGQRPKRKQPLANVPAKPDTAAENTAITWLLDKMMAQLTTPWMQFFLHTDPSRYLENTHIPMLALLGSHDVQVVADRNVKPLKRAAEANGNPFSQVIVLKGHNHLFQKAPANLGIRYDEVEQTISPQTLRTIEKWLQKVLASQPQKATF